MGLMRSFVAVAGPVDAIAEGLMAQPQTIDVDELGERNEIDSIHDSIEAVFEGRGPLADAVIYGGRSLDSADRDWTVLDADDLPPLVDMMTRMNFESPATTSCSAPASSGRSASGPAG